MSRFKGFQRDNRRRHMGLFANKVQVLQLVILQCTTSLQYVLFLDLFVPFILQVIYGFNTIIYYSINYFVISYVCQLKKNQVHTCVSFFSTFNVNFVENKVVFKIEYILVSLIIQVQIQTKLISTKHQ